MFDNYQPWSAMIFHHNNWFQIRTWTSKMHRSRNSASCVLGHIGPFPAIGFRIFRLDEKAKGWHPLTSIYLRKKLLPPKFSAPFSSCGKVEEGGPWIYKPSNNSGPSVPPHRSWQSHQGQSAMAWQSTQTFPSGKLRSERSANTDWLCTLERDPNSAWLHATTCSIVCDTVTLWRCSYAQP